MSVEININKAVKKYGNLTIIPGLDEHIKNGEFFTLLGPSGCGKTTLLRMILGEILPSEGRIKTGHNVAFGYYDQGQLLLNDNNTVLEELKESYRLYTDTEMRSILGRFLFKGEDVFLNVGSLSGGEKARLSLLKMMLSGANTLILDEPTNHLDIDSKEVFEDALMEFEGTVIVVSHDRYFLQKIPTRILELEEDGLTEYLGKYDYYVDKKAQVTSGKKYLQNLSEAVNVQGSNAAKSAAQQESAGTSQLSEKELRKIAKQKEAEERRKRRQMEELEANIAAWEEEIENLNGQISDPANALNYQLLAELSDKSHQLQEQIDEAFMQWAELDEQ